MVDQFDLLQRDERAAEAKELLDNPLLQEIFRRLEEEAVEQLTRAGPGSPQALAEHHRLQALRAIHADIIRLVDDPKMLRAARERRRRFSQ